MASAESTASWREEFPGEVVTDIETSVALLLERGAELLEKNGEVAPFGMGVEGTDPATEYYPVMADPGRVHGNRSQAAITAMVDGFRQDRDRWRVAAIAYDVLLEGGHDALCLDVEHSGGYALKVLAPYKRGGLRRKVRFTEGEVSHLEPRIWS